MEKVSSESHQSEMTLKRNCSDLLRKFQSKFSWRSTFWVKLQVCIVNLQDKETSSHVFFKVLRMSASNDLIIYVAFLDLICLSYFGVISVDQCQVNLLLQRWINDGNIHRCFWSLKSASPLISVALVTIIFRFLLVCDHQLVKNQKAVKPLRY